MRLEFTVRMSLDGKELDAKLASLLEGLHAQGSLAAAARSIGCSYRYAWDRLRAAHREYGEQLVHLERGRGARLSEFGQQLIAAQARARTATHRALEEVARESEAQLGTPRTSTSPGISITASHDLGLIELKHFCALAVPPLILDLRFRGSLEALSDLARDRCDLAGFHVGPDAHAEATLRRILTPRQHKLIVLADRCQGLMVASGNPKHIRKLPDLWDPLESTCRHASLSIL